MGEQPGQPGEHPQRPPDAPPDQPATVLVIGVGNEYRGDDAAGRAVARRLRALVPPGIPVIEETGEGASLMNVWDGADLVILCDAVYSGATPGTVHRIDARRDSIPAGMYRYSSHAFGVAEAVELARVLSTLPRRLVIYGIEVRQTAAGEPISPEIARAVEQVAGQVLADLPQPGSPSRDESHA